MNMPGDLLSEPAAEYRPDPASSRAAAVESLVNRDQSFRIPPTEDNFRPIDMWSLAAQNAPTARAPQVGSETEAGDVWKQIRNLLKPKADKDPVAEALARADAAMAGLPPLGDYYNSAANPSTRARPRAMTPMEGPDDGSTNPNALDAAGAPAGYFRGLRGAESSNDDGAVNKSGAKPTYATGRYQFLPTTWAAVMKEAPHLGLTPEGIKNGQQQETAVRHYTDKSLNLLHRQLNRTPTSGELYALHLLGHAGGMNLIQNASEPVGATVSRAAISANPWLKAYVNRPGTALISRLQNMIEPPQRTD